MRDPQHVLITGGNSGIGEALARAYAAPGMRIALSGRDASRLEAAAAACRAKGARVAASAVDVTDGPAMASWIATQDEALPLDLVIANAGISAGTASGGESIAQARLIFATNLDGVINTVHPAVSSMVPRRRGQIAIMSSLAAFRGYAGAPAYSASKAAVRIYGEALRSRFAGKGIEVSVICPGFVRSRMTAVNEFPMPFLMDADRAAAIVKRQLARNKSRIAFPWPMYAAAWLLAALPPALTDRLMARLPQKSSVRGVRAG